MRISVLFILFLSVIFYVQPSFATNGTLTREKIYSEKTQNIINAFQSADFLKICQTKKCDVKKSDWIKIGTEETWIHATNSGDASDYLTGCALYGVNKSFTKAKPSIVPEAKRNEWWINGKINYLELGTVLWAWVPTQYWDTYDFIARNPRYTRKVENEVIVEDGEVDLLKNKKTNKLSVLICKFNALPNEKTALINHFGE